MTDLSTSACADDTTLPAGPSDLDVAIPEPVRELLTAISEVLTLPVPGGDRMDLVRYESCVSERIHLVKLIIGDVLAGKAENGLGWEAAYLRRQDTARPPRYRTSEQEMADLRRLVEGGGQ